MQTTCSVSFGKRCRGVPETLTFDVPVGTTLLDAARGAGLPIARACTGLGLCGRCDLEIVGDTHGLSPETADERETRDRVGIPATRRLACQARVTGPVRATASYW